MRREEEEEGGGGEGGRRGRREKGKVVDSIEGIMHIRHNGCNRRKHVTHRWKHGKSQFLTTFCTRPGLAILHNFTL